MIGAVDITRVETAAFESAGSSAATLDIARSAIPGRSNVTRAPNDRSINAGSLPASIVSRDRLPSETVTVIVVTPEKPGEVRDGASF